MLHHSRQSCAHFLLKLHRLTGSLMLAQGGAVQGVSGWVQYTAPDGQKYYHHVPSDTTQWEVPEGWMPLQ